MGDVLFEGDFRLDPDLPVWEQQPGEPVEHHAAFRRYCRLAKRINPKTGEPLPRHLPDMVDDTKWSLRHLRKIANQFLWLDRANAHDLEAEAELGGKIADARLTVMQDRLNLLGEIRGLTLQVLKEKDPADWKTRDLLELLKIQFMAEDNLLGIATRGANSYNGVGVGVDVHLPMGESTQVIQSQIDEVMAELEQRRGGQVAAADLVADDIDDDE